jgi:D-arabinose 1-dehydrogenase-like Zn-dependent alcohol dehydrogenase
MGAWKDGRLNLFIFGIGYSGIEIAKAARVQGAQVAGTTRSEAKAAKFTGRWISAKRRAREAIGTHIASSHLNRSRCGR